MLQEHDKRLKSRAGAGGTVNNSGLDIMQEDFAKLKEDLDSLKDRSDKKFKELDIELNGKADKSELEKLQNELTKDMNDYIEAILKNFVNQEVFDKKIAQLTKKIKEILEMISKVGSPNEDDAMFTKRPFGQVSCASCQKNIVNLQGIA